MAMAHIELSGSAYEIGRRQCERLGVIAGYKYRKQFHLHADEAPVRDLGPMIEWIGRNWPDQLEEVRGYADGLGADFEYIFDIHFGAYVGALMEQQSCSNVGFRESPNGPLLGGNLDDDPGYIVQTTRREGAYAHVGIVWPGWLSYWGGVNEHGLAVSGSSARVLKTAPPVPQKPPAFHSVYTARLVVETCRDVPEAIELLKQPGIAGHGNHIMVDAAGNGVVVETHKPTGPYLADRGWEPGGWICCGNFFFSEFTVDEAAVSGFEGLAERANRVRIMEAFGRRSEVEGASIELLQELCATHDGPGHGLGGICNQNNVCSVISLPRERRVLVAERFPCVNKYVEYAL